MSKNMGRQLNKEQEKAKSHVKGPAIVVAGPGSGKTRVIIERISHLIGDKQVDPAKILVTTFTEKAAGELKARLARRIKKDAQYVHISTIHALCKSLLEEFFSYHTFGSQFSVLDSESQSLFINVNKAKGKIDIAGRRGWRDIIMNNKGPRKRPEYIVANLYNFFTANMIKTEKLISHLVGKGQLTHDMEKLIRGYDAYIELLYKEKLIDFENLQALAYTLLRDNDEVRSIVENKFDYIMVDEYQDTSPLQDNLFRLMCGRHNNIFVVGDENQSIYAFRGGSVENFQLFTERYKNAKEYFLSTNYRSTRNIVQASNKLMEKEIRAKLEANREKKGSKIVYISGDTSDATAAGTIDFLKTLRQNNSIRSYGDVAVLYRTRSVARDYFKHIEQEEIPFVTFGDGRFLEREEIQTLVYMMGYVAQKEIMESKFTEWDNWWKRDLFTNEVFGFSENTINAIHKLPYETNLYELDSESSIATHGISNTKDAAKIRLLNKLRQNFEKQRDNKEEVSALKLFYDLLKVTGYMKRLLDEKDEQAKEKLYNLSQLSAIIDRYEHSYFNLTIHKLLENIYFAGKDNAFDQKKIENSDTLKMMTVHKSKGLEFPVVVVCSLNEGKFPMDYREETEICGVPIDKQFYYCESQAERNERKHYAEELRLFYVALTRTKDLLVVTVPEKKNNHHKMEKSRFLALIEEYITDEFSSGERVDEKYEIPVPINNLSYSSVNTYLDCPFRYDLLYNYGFSSPGIFTQKQGTIIHNVLQRINLDIMNGTEISGKTISGYLEEYWIPLYSARNKKKTAEKKEELAQKLGDYYASVIHTFRKIIAVEHPFNFIADNFTLKGRVDLVVEEMDGRVALIDFKSTNKGGLVPTNVATQLNVYRYCLGDVDIDILKAYTVMDNYQEEYIYDKQKTSALLSDISEKIENGCYERNQNSGLCKSGRCTFKFVCTGE